MKHCLFIVELLLAATQLLMTCGCQHQAARAELPFAIPQTFVITETSRGHADVAYEDSRGAETNPDASSGNSQKPAEPNELAAPREIINPVPDPVEATKRPFRAIMWSPDWCTVCITNGWLLEDGHADVAYEKRTGDERKFPKEVQEYANGRFQAGTTLAGQQRGWPVWQIEHSDGGWVFCYHGRSFDDLIAIHNLPRGQPVPASTMNKARYERLGRDLKHGGQMPPPVRPSKHDKVALGNPMHAHRCPFDGSIWWHRGDEGDFYALHCCPKCGRFQDEVHSL